MHMSKRAVRAAMTACALMAIGLVPSRAIAASASFVAGADGDVTVYQDATPTEVVTDEATIDFGPSTLVGDFEGFGILEFDLAGIDVPGVMVSSAMLTGRLDAVRVPGSDITLQGYVGDLMVTESDAAAGGATVGTLIDAEATTFSIPIDAAFVQGVLNGVADPVAGLRASVANGTLIRMESTEWPGGMSPPTLVVEYVPEPSAMVLVIAAALPVALRRAKRSRARRQ